MKPRAFSYLRFSSPEQIKGDSKRRQSTKSAEWCSRNDVPLDDSLNMNDEGISAYRGKNAKQGAMSDFLDACKIGRVRPGDYLIVESLDRITRQSLGLAQALIQQILVAGVNIVTLTPERVFTAGGQNDLGQTIEILVVLSRGHDESRMKSERVGAAWRNKKENAKDKKLTKMGPSWLRLSKDRESWELRKDRVAIVRRLFDMARTVGATAICSVLNREKVPTLGRGKSWGATTVKRILRGREVLGEYQPHTKKEDGSRTPVGKPVKDYYPTIIDEKLYYRVQAAMQSRVIKGGAVTKRVSNLFTGLLFDTNERPFRYKSDAKWQFLVAEGVYLPYSLIEASLLVWAADLRIADVVMDDKRSKLKRLPDLAAKVEDIDKRISKVKARIKKDAGIDVLMDLLVVLQAEREQTQNELDFLTVESASTATEAVKDIKTILKTEDGAERYESRLRLRRALGRTVKRITLSNVEKQNGVYTLKLDIELGNCKQRSVLINGSRVWWSRGVPKLPSAKKAKLSKGKTVHTLDLARHMPDLAKYSEPKHSTADIVEMRVSGKSIKEIAAIVGFSQTKVSRTLIAGGHRTQQRKAADSDEVMNWHPGANGWVKTYKGERYYVGCGTLRDFYPKLVDGEGKTRGETVAAANRWWRNTQVS